MATREILPMPRRAYRYIRFSSAEQSKGDSTSRQVDYAAEMCEEHGWVLDDTLLEPDEGVSAFKGKNRYRGQLAAFLLAVKEKRVSPGSVLVVEQFDRLSREEIDPSTELVKNLLRAGVWVAFHKNKRVYTPASLNDPLVILELVFEAYTAHNYSKNLSGRITHSWATRKKAAVANKKPLGKRCPVWLEWLPEEGQYRLIPKRAELVSEVFRLATDGLGLHRIAQHMRTEGRPTMAAAGTTDASVLSEKRRRSPTGSAWTKEYVRVILQSRATFGEYQPRKRGEAQAVGADQRRPADGPAVPNFYPAVITEEEWNQAQVAIRRRKKRSGRPGQLEANLFTGIVYHALTRERLSMHSKWGKGQKYLYLRGYRDSEVKYCGSGTGFRYEQFEEGVLEMLEALRPQDVLPPHPEEEAREKRIAELTARVEKLSQRGEDIRREMADPEGGSLAELKASHQEVKVKVAALVLERDRLKEDSLTGKGQALGEIQSCVQLLEEARGTPKEEALRLRLKARLRMLVEDIWVHPQVVTAHKIILHTQLYLRGVGKPIYKALPPDSLPPGVVPWDLSGADFRSGDEGDDARRSRGA